MQEQEKGRLVKAMREILDDAHPEAQYKALMEMCEFYGVNIRVHEELRKQTGLAEGWEDRAERLRWEVKDAEKKTRKAKLQKKEIEEIIQKTAEAVSDRLLERAGLLDDTLEGVSPEFLIATINKGGKNDSTTRI